ncbi:DUF4474 domain-containing protein, partial [Ruminiclostridium hungatei]|uniref:DUF4474 domain-containing protein n=1 Tax=Ruminiclostridium hungatei TaxID=48256 RepID=UPI000E3CA336
NKTSTIINYSPGDKQWWITGFNPNYKGVNANNLTVSYTVTFNNSTMYNDFKKSLKPEETRWVFDDKKSIATFKF